MVKILFYLLILSLFLSLLKPSQIYAHPIDEFGEIKAYDQKQTLEVARESTKLTIDLTFYALDKIKVWESIDANRDQKVQDEEANVWMKKGQEASWLEVNSDRKYFEATGLTFPNYHDFFSYQPANVRIEFMAKKEVAPNQEIFYYYQGKDKKLEEIEFSAKGISNLKVENLVKISPDSISFTLVPGQELEGSVLGLSTNNRLNAFLSKYIKADNLPPKLLLIALFSAFLIGALHALTPGHGKAIVASYLIGERGTFLHAVNLGIIITITHTASVFLLGLAALLLTEYFVPAKVVKGLSLASALLIVGFGMVLLIQRIVSLSKKHKHEHEHAKLNTVTFKNLLALGVSGGIVPCVDALAILVIAVSLQKIFLGLTMLFSFSLGLATALISAGVLAVATKEVVSKKYEGIHRYQHYLGIFSALVVTILGLAMLVKL